MDKTRGQQRCWRKLNELSEIVGLDSKFVFVFHIWLFKVVFLFSQMSFFQCITTLNGLSKALLLPRGEKLQFIKKNKFLKIWFWSFLWIYFGNQLKIPTNCNFSPLGKINALLNHRYLGSKLWIISVKAMLKAQRQLPKTGYLQSHYSCDKVH